MNQHAPCFVIVSFLVLNCVLSVLSSSYKLQGQDGNHSGLWDLVGAQIIRAQPNEGCFPWGLTISSLKTDHA